jgi:hypothetical protein
MLHGTHYVGAYWLARHESAEACARRTETFFQLLGRCDPAWSEWKDSAAPKREQERPVSLDAVTFTRMFGKKKYQQGPDGFRFLFWSGASVPESASVYVRCGAASPLPPSACVLTPPAQGPVSERVLTASSLAAVLRAMALAWEPEWGVATSHEDQAQVTKGSNPDTFVGWVMYFSRQRGTVPPLPAPARVEPVEDQGTLVILTPERFSVSNPEHAALAARVHALLDGAGLLGPLRPAAPA